MEVKNSVIMSPNFIPAVDKLLKVEMPIKNCIELAEAVDKINDKLKSLSAAKKAIMTRFAKLDEKGEIVTQPAISDPNLRTPIFESEESASAFALEIQGMLDEVTDVAIKSKIKINGNLMFTTDDLMAIKDLIEVT